MEVIVDELPNIYEIILLVGSNIGLSTVLTVERHLRTEKPVEEFVFLRSSDSPHE